MPWPFIFLLTFSLHLVVHEYFFFLPLSIIPSLSLMMMMIIAMAALTSVLSQENRVCCFEVLLPFFFLLFKYAQYKLYGIKQRDVCIGMQIR